MRGRLCLGKRDGLDGGGGLKVEVRCYLCEGSRLGRCRCLDNRVRGGFGFSESDGCGGRRRLGVEMRAHGGEGLGRRDCRDYDAGSGGLDVGDSGNNGIAAGRLDLGDV